MYFTDACVSTGISVLMYIVLRYVFTKFITKEPFDVFTTRGLIGTSLLAIVMFLINFYWVESQQEAQQKKETTAQVMSGQSFKAPELEAVTKPLNVSMSYDASKAQNSDVTEIVTKYATYRFATYGACLQSMDMHWQQGTMHIPVITQQQPSFLLGLSEDTPMDYELVRHDTSDNGLLHTLEYQARVAGATIVKIFVVHTDSYQIDISAQAVSKLEKSEQFRLFVATPVEQQDVKVVVNKAGASSKLENINLSNDASFQEFWFEPNLFGCTSKFLTSVYFSGSDKAVARAYLKKLGQSEAQVVLESAAVHDVPVTWSWYVGPKSQQELAKVSEKLPVLMQYGWLTMIIKPLVYLLDFCYQKTHSYGWAIILVALLIKLLLLPFTLKGERSMKQQAEFEKKRSYLQQKYKHDKAALDQATAELISKHGIPMLSGCLPMLLNFPVFIALNTILSNSVELHGASFMWLSDLSAKDPYYIISMLVFVGMVASPAPTVDPRQWFSRIGFALLVAAVAASLSSGLALFIMVNTLFGVVQAQISRRLS
ncbi:membrane protein insertase YidC [Candidatus Babeliales bacterium]|nr:membrane protein insertase YidC [Candidatus Babeliales bacterium]